MAKNLGEARFQSLLSAPAVFSPEGVLTTLREIVKTLGTDPPFKVRATGARGDDTSEQILTAAGGDPISVVLQVSDARLRPLREPFLVEAWIATTAGGLPGGTQTVSSPSAGTIRKQESANQAFLYHSDGSGSVAFTVTAATGTRYLHVSVCGMVHTIKLVWS